MQFNQMDRLSVAIMLPRDNILVVIITGMILLLHLHLNIQVLPIIQTMLRMFSKQGDISVEELIQLELFDLFEQTI